ncbi:MAG: hypothetical protein H6Q74_981 [Firmicutes bacterium]|nr:hypothetical protein [Bacillota bacterium]
MSKEDITINPEELRPNFKISSSAQEPVYTTSASSASQPEYTADVTNLNYASQGLLYTLTTPAAIIQTSNFMALNMSNPTTSGKTAYLMQCSAYNSGKPNSASNYTRIDIYRNASVTTTGAIAATAQNTNLGSSTTSSCTAYYVALSSNAVSGTASATRVESIGNPVIFDFNGGYVVPAGKSFTIQAYNNTNGTNVISLNLSWLEK